MVSGYHSRILVVDLSRGKSFQWSPPEEFYKLYIGGRGIGGRLLAGLVSSDVDPFSPDNVIIFAAGPLTGTRIPMSSRLHVVFKSPATGAWGEASMGGSFPYFMRHAGVDALLVRGRAPRPVYIVVRDGGAEVRSAEHLWGLNAYEAEKALVEEAGGKGEARAAVIGPAGENLVRYAAITHGSLELGIGRGGQAGRTGGGAVMGSKRLKGIVVVKGSPPPIDDEGKVDEYAAEMLRRISRSERAKMLREYGTSAMYNVAQSMKFLPTLYWSRVTYEYFEETDSQALRSILKRPVACMMCPIGCGRHVEARVRGKVVETEGPEYETMYSFGSLSGIKSIAHVALLNDYADRLGLDTISFGNVYAFAVEAQKAGKLELPYRLDYGDHEAMLRLMEDVAHARGEHGKLLGLGVAAAAAKLGVRGAVHVKGVEPSGYDPRGLWSMYLAYATSPRGACHLRAMAYMIDIRGLAGPSRSLDESKVKLFAEWEDWCSLFDSLVLCKFGRDFYGFNEMARALKAVTGWDVDEGWIREAARRITNIAHFYNRGLHGLGANADRLPARWFGSTPDGAKPAGQNDVMGALKTYYRLRGFREDGTMKTEQPSDGFEHELESLK